MKRRKGRRSEREPKQVVIISPHFDDVPLSLGESLRSGALAPHRVRVRVVFGRTNWTSWFHPTPSRARLVSLWRRIEETIAALVFRYRWTAAGWEEVVLRTGELDSSSFLDQHTDLSDEPLVTEIAEWLALVCGSPAGVIGARGSGAGPGAKPDLVLVPAGLGGHRDHLIIASAAASVIDRVDVPIGFYEDRPYSAYLSRAVRSEHMATLLTDLAVHAVSAPVRISTQWLVRACYRSQMTDYFAEAMQMDRRTGDTERVWFVSGRQPEWLLADRA